MSQGQQNVSLDDEKKSHINTNSGLVGPNKPRRTNSFEKNRVFYIPIFKGLKGLSLSFCISRSIFSFSISSSAFCYFHG